VILISVGYEPRVAGEPLDSMAFGPVSNEGGERRLNVLFTRARVRCEVFVSFDPGDINLERTTGDGPRVLKRFLRYAENGILQEFRPTGADFDSPFEAEAIESFGYKPIPKSAQPDSRSTSRYAIRQNPAATCLLSNATGQLITQRFGQENATGCVSKSWKD
jgi:hypothetical protein